MEALTPRRPFILRAFYDWLLDNDLTPHIVVDATMSGVRVPLEFVQDGQIVLNIAPRAVGNLQISDEAVMFNARFSGRPHLVDVPMYAIQAIYARENGAGTMFEPEPSYEALLEKLESDIESEPKGFEPVTVSSSDPSPTPDSPTERPPTGRPTLKVVK